MTAVRLERITKHFGQTVALDGIDLSIAAGEVFFLLGPSGCGKSTLLRIIAGLTAPTSGHVYFNDDDVTGLSTEKRNAVMCFQSYALWPHLSVEENVRFGLDVRKVGREQAHRRVAEALAQVQMAALAKRKPNELSGGQQQRVALARALVVQPDCLLLDEPLSNLDAKLRLEMRSEIRRICRSAGLTAIYVTHDQKEALSIADRMAVLNAGKIEQIGRPQDLYLRPGNRFVAAFMGESNFLDGTVRNINGQLAEVETAIGALTSAIFPADLKRDEKVIISLRPEVIHIGDSTAAHNRFNATIHNTLYLGEVAQHRVTINQTDLKATELNPRIVARDDATQQASIWFSEQDVILLKS